MHISKDIDLWLFKHSLVDVLHSNSNSKVWWTRYQVKWKSTYHNGSKSHSKKVKLRKYMYGDSPGHNRIYLPLRCYLQCISKYTKGIENNIFIFSLFFMIKKVKEHCQSGGHTPCFIDCPIRSEMTPNGCYKHPGF